jgi:hypothetical protein
MKPFPVEILSARPDILRAKHSYGLWFGAALGLTFSTFAWGLDAYALSQMNGFYPWLKFLGGVIPCMLVGALTGWLSARLDKPLLAMLLWCVAASVFAWLTISLPLQITPRILRLADPGIKDLLHYGYFEDFSARFGVAYFWLIIFIAIAGLLQIPLSDSAVFSTSLFGKIAPMLMILVLMAICGTILDSLNNELQRSSIDAVNTTVQFILDHRGKEINPVEIRRMHIGALRSVDGLITPERSFIVSGYDPILEKAQVLARFKEAWVECELISNQLVNCKQVGASG